MNDDQIGKLRKKASHALAQAAHYLEATEQQRLIESKKFEELIVRTEQQSVRSSGPQDSIQSKKH